MSGETTRMDWPRLTRLAVTLAGVALGGLRPAQQAWAQAAATADRRYVLSVFAGGSRIYTDYNADNYGFFVGADYMRRFRRFSVGLDGRYTGSGGNIIREHSIVAGLKAEKGFGRFHPYASFEIGYGVIKYVPVPAPYDHDNSVVYDTGAGFDYRVSRVFSVKIDAQQQYWKLGHATSELEPYNVNIGLVYRIPFGFAGHKR